MKHKHANLIEAWTNDNSIKFEFAYGTGVDFIWTECEIHYVIENPNVQIRIKEDKGLKMVKRWVVYNSELRAMEDVLFETKENAMMYYNYPDYVAQYIQIEIVE